MCSANPYNRRRRRRRRLFYGDLVQQKHDTSSTAKRANDRSVVCDSFERSVRFRHRLRRVGSLFREQTLSAHSPRCSIKRTRIFRPDVDNVTSTWIENTMSSRAKFTPDRVDLTVQEIDHRFYRTSYWYAST